MPTAALRIRRAVLASLGAMLGTAATAWAADLDPTRVPAVEALPMPRAWTYRFTPYSWLTALNGTSAVRGRSVKVDASFADIVENSDMLVGLMGDLEARNGPIALLANVAWTKIGVERGDVRSRSLAPDMTGTPGTSLGLDIEMAIAEVGAAYEVVRFGAVAFDFLGGARYWYQEADLSLNVTAAVQVGDLEVAGTRAFARSGSVDWLDPMIGARMRYTVAPGHELWLRGDIGGFGIGSDVSWQAIGAYGFEFGTYQGITFSGVIGYRALYVDYV